MDRTWRPERPVPVTEALDRLLDDMEARYDERHLEGDHLLPHSTGILALDKVCEGGLRAGTVTALEGPLGAQTRALLYSCARRAEVRTLLAVEQVVHGARWLLAGAAGVPAELLRNLTLSENDWRQICEGLPALGQRELALTDAPTIRGIEHVIAQHEPAIVLVEQPDRFADPTNALGSLVALAHDTGVAVLTASAGAAGGFGAVAERVVRVAVAPHSLGGHAALVSTDGPSGLAAAQVDITALTATAS